jgi:hypothetical protein
MAGVDSRGLIYIASILLSKDQTIKVVVNSFFLYTETWEMNFYDIIKLPLSFFRSTISRPT